MKKKYHNILYVLCITFVAVSILPSCLKEEKNIFPEEASERMQKVINSYYTELESAENGWIFEYFPGGKDILYGGYAYTIRFKDKKATVSFEMAEDIAQEETSLYKIVENGGPTLTFDTYNKLLHFFSTPNGEMYQGLQGDYEFLLMSTSQTKDTIYVEGKKYGTQMRLIKMKEESKSYLSKLKANAGVIDASGSIFVTVDGKTVTNSISERKYNLSFSINDEEKTINAPYVVTDKGIRFHQSFTLFGKTVSELFLSADKKSLQSDDKSINIEFIYPPFDVVKPRWDIAVDKNNISDKFNAVFLQVTEANYNAYEEQLSTTITLGNNISGIHFYSVTKEDRMYRSIHGLNFNGVPGNPTQLDINLGRSDLQNWSYYTHLAPMVYAITENSPYNTEMDNAEKPTKVKLSSAKDPDFWFFVTLK